MPINKLMNNSTLLNRFRSFSIEDFKMLCYFYIPVIQKTEKIQLQSKALSIYVEDTGHYWYLLKIIVSMKTYFVHVMSNGELLII